MRTSMDIDDDLLAQAMAATGLATKKATVEEALRRVVRRRQQVQAIQDMAGTGEMCGLADMREGQGADPHQDLPPSTAP